MTAVETRRKDDRSHRAASDGGDGIAILALAFASIFITQLERASVPPITIAFYRMALATLSARAGSPRLQVARNAFALKARPVVAFSGRALPRTAFRRMDHFVQVHSHRYVGGLGQQPSTLVVIAAYFFLGDRPTRPHIAAR